MMLPSGALSVRGGKTLGEFANAAAYCIDWTGICARAQKILQVFSIRADNASTR
jgi:hypothetical protein